MRQPVILISINASWNILNFRLGLIAALQQRGFRVIALAPPDEYSERLPKLGIEYFAIPMDKQGMSPARDLQLLWRYRKILTALRPDIYLGYTAKPNIYGTLAAHSLKIPVINNVAGLGTAFMKPGLLAGFVSRLYKVAFRRSATVFFQNPDDMAMFVRRGLVRTKQAQLLPGSGIDLQRFSPQPTDSAKNGEFKFLLIARLLWDKGVREYVEAARLVREAAPEARFQMLGFLDVANRTAVRRVDVDAWVTEGFIDYLGTADDVRPAIAAADAIVLPSYREGLPRVLLEGAAMGKPLIATDVPGCRHVVQNGVNGFLCAVRDPRALAEAMLKLLQLPRAEYDRLGAAARAGAERDYGEQVVADRYLSAIESAFAQSRSDRLR